MDEKQLELFEAYLNGELSNIDKIAFEEKLSKEPLFKEDFDLYQNINNTLASRFNNKNTEESLRKTLQSIQGNTSKKRSKKVIPLFSMKKILVAASIALLVTLSVFNYNNKPSFNDYNSYDSLSLTVRGDNDIEKQLLEKYFNNKQFAKALPLFESLLKDNPNDNKLILYKALALLETGNTNESLVLFDKLIQGENKLYKDNSLWYKSLAYLKIKDYPKCKETLLKINSDSDYYNEVQELIKSLE
jgi:predicted Zn-dependent protease